MSVSTPALPYLTQRKARKIMLVNITLEIKEKSK